MSGGSRALALFLFAVWAVWLFALQSLFGSVSALGRFVPELGLVLALAVLARAEARDLPWLVLALALARSAFAVDPLPAVLFGAASVLALAFAVRSVVETSGTFMRTVLAGVSVFLFDAWLIGVHEISSARATGEAWGATFGGRLFDPWPVAIASAVCALVVGELLSRLPGLSPLRSRQW